tara:strand:+ start:574 stop:780 length:207 start_codon:yes stop_codon:yes gene_type:complete
MEELQGEFVIKEQGEILRFDRCGDLPDEFDHLIKFAPVSPEPPHTEEQHNEMSKYTQYLQELVSRERK